MSNLDPIHTLLDCEGEMSKGQLVGYICVSTEAQNTARQEEALADLKLDKTLTDKASGKETDRP
ncbi:Resolvase, N-terminal catalytic domain containing protein [Burkholderiaceae bacterium]|jgi:hypothetical protein